MPNVTWGNPQPGDITDSAAYNQLLLDLLSVSSGLARDNFAAEGMTRDRFVENPVGSEVFFIQSLTRENVGLSAGAWATLAFPTSSPISFSSGSVVVPVEAQMLVQSRIHFSSSLANGVGIPASTNLQMRIVYQASGGSPLFLSPSFRNAHTDLTNGHAVISCFGILPGPVTYDFVRLEYQMVSGAGVVIPGVGSFWGRNLNKVD